MMPEIMALRDARAEQATAPRACEALPRTLVLRDGTRVTVRAIRPEDKPLLISLFGALSPESRYQRFMGAITGLTGSQLRDFTEIDHVSHEAWIAVDPDAPYRAGLGVARYVRLANDPTMAEVAVAVIDSHQGRGLGSALLALVSRSAADQGIETFIAYVFDSNPGMIRIFRDLGAIVRRRDGGVLSIDVPVLRDVERIPDTPTGRAFRVIAGGDLRVAASRPQTSHPSTLASGTDP